MEILNNDTFSTKVNSGATLAVDFYADWCGPCKMLSPILETLAPDFAGKLEIVKVNIDDCPEIAQKYGVTSIPTIVFFKNSEIVDRMTGFQSKDSLAAKFNSVV